MQLSQQNIGGHIFGIILLGISKGYFKVRKLMQFIILGILGIYRKGIQTSLLVAQNGCPKGILALRKLGAGGVGGLIHKFGTCELSNNEGPPLCFYCNIIMIINNNK